MRWKDVELLSPGLPEGGRKLLLVLGGRAPDTPWLDSFRQEGWELWAVDRGVEACRRAGWLPRLVLGDRDSASPADWDWAVSAGGEERLFCKDKDATDFQLALQELAEIDPRPQVLLTGAFGGRLDHLWSLMHSFLPGTAWTPLGMADQEEGVYLLPGPGKVEVRFGDPIPQAVSLLPLRGDCEGVGISGVRWPLVDTHLALSHPYAVSNRLEGGEGGFRAEVRRGTLGVYWCLTGA